MVSVGGHIGREPSSLSRPSNGSLGRVRGTSVVPIGGGTESYDVYLKRTQALRSLRQ